MANSLLELFGDTTLEARDLVTLPARNLTDLVASGTADVDGIRLKAELVNRVVPKVDYSDFSNFVFFNSALDYFNISGDRIINEYPFDGTFEDVLTFQSQSDHYQNYLLSVWPHWSGALACTEASGSPYVVTSDTKVSVTPPILSPNTGSFTIEFRMYVESFPATGSAATIVQRSPNEETIGYTFNTISPQLDDPSWNVFIGNDAGASASINLYLSGVDGGVSGVFSYNIPKTSAGYYAAWVVDQSGSEVHLFLTQPASGSIAKFSNQFITTATGPTYTWAATFPSGGLDARTSYFVVGSGSMPPIQDFGFTGTTASVDISEVRYWNLARSKSQIFTTHNVRTYQTPSLKLYWRFAEPYQSFDEFGQNTYVAKDYSGNQLHGNVVNGSSAAFVAASAFGDAGFGMSPQEPGEPILSVHSPLVRDYVTRTQWAGPILNLSDTTSDAVRNQVPQSGSAMYFDRNNANIITNLVPRQFLFLEDQQNTDVLKNLLYLLARQFDELKVYVDQITKVFVANQSGYNTTPDALLDDALQFWGWDTKGNFLNKEAFQYFFGVGVKERSPEEVTQQIWSNEKLDTQLYEIKNEFWRRTLNSLPYLYKKKGTKEAVDALFRIYGLDSSVVRLKEFGYKPNVKIQTQRINGVKSATALKMHQVSGTFYVSSSIDTGMADGMFTVDMQLMLPPSGSALLPPTQLTGTIYSTKTGDENFEMLYYTRKTPGDTPAYEGTLTYQSLSPGITSSVTFSSVPIFNGGWYHMNVFREGDIVNLNFEHLDGDQVDTSFALTGSVTGVMSSSFSFCLGDVTGQAGHGEFWARSVQLWHMSQSLAEVRDHTLNPFSRGTDLPDRLDNLMMWWRFDELIDGDNEEFFDSSGNSRSGVIVHETLPGTYTWAGGATHYGRFNVSYNFIAPPDFNWTEEKIRYLSGSAPSADDHWAEINDASIELNLIDALNEDISTVISSLDNWNNMIGMPVSRYRDQYLELEKLRQQYFSRLTGRINFRAFADFLDFFDRSFLDLVKRLMPARVDFKGAELVVESHMLERPKVVYGYRFHEQVLVPEGIVTIYSQHPPLLTTTFVSGNSS